MKKILVAEDNDSNFILMSYILKKFYQFERAKNGQEAVEMAEKHPDLPIVALTANAFDSDRQLAEEAGCDDFLSKPVSSEACIETIKRFVGE